EVCNGAEAGVAAAGVVHREAESAVAEGLEVLLEARVVLDRGPLGDLEHDAARVIDAEIGRVEIAERRVVEVVRVDVQEEVLALLQLVENAFHRAPAQQSTQLPDQVCFLCDLEEN